MERAAFETPLSDEQLKELGRLVVNYGVVEFLLGMHVSSLCRVESDARIELISPLSTRRKLDILKSGLMRIPRDATRALVGEGCKLIDPTLRDRNVLLHGIWGFDSEKSDGKPIVASTKDRHSRLDAAAIIKTADALAISSRKLIEAFVVDGGHTPLGEPERLVIVP